MPMATNLFITSDANRSLSSVPDHSTSHADAAQPITERGELKSKQPVEAAGAVKINRRSIMNMMVSTAIAGAAVSTATEGSAANPDAEIIAAGKAFEPLLSKYLDVRFVWTRLAREGRAEMEAKFPDGAGDDFEGPIGHHPKWNFHKQVLDRNGCSDASNRLSAIYQEMEPFADLIRSSGSETIEGMRAKLLVAIWDCQPMCATHDGCFDFNNAESHWSLFNAAVAVTGLSAMVSELETRLQADATVFHDEAEEEVDEEEADA
jgi:hypothetical protein